MLHQSQDQANSANRSLSITHPREFHRDQLPGMWCNRKKFNAWMCMRCPYLMAFVKNDISPLRDKDNNNKKKLFDFWFFLMTPYDFFSYSSKLIACWWIHVCPLKNKKSLTAFKSIKNTSAYLPIISPMGKNADVWEFLQ